MKVNFTKIATSKKVCEKCCKSRNQGLRWGEPEWDCEEWYDHHDCDNFYCPVLERTVYNPDNIGSVQADCPRRFEHAEAAGVFVDPEEVPQEVQLQLFELEHESFHYKRRVHGLDERIYLEHWRDTNKRRRGINNGITYLEHLLCPEGQHPQTVTQRDAFVAASVIQWLGTNCGSAFIHECERKIKKEKGLKGYLEHQKRMEARQQREEAQKDKFRKEVAERLMGYVWALFTMDEWFFLTEIKPVHRTGIGRTVGGWEGLEDPIFEERDPVVARGYAKDFSVSRGHPVSVARSKAVRMGLF